MGEFAQVKEMLAPMLEILPLWFDQLFTQVGAQLLNDLGPAAAMAGFDLDNLTW